MDKELVDKVNNIYWQYNVLPQVVKKPQNLAVLTSICSFGRNTNRGPIGVSKCLFNGKEHVTLITLGGTQFKDGQATRFLESKLSMKGKDNDYLTALLRLLDSDVIDKDNPLIISGISLGGMIVQQILSRDEVLNKFKIKSIITFGSPLTKPLDRKGIRVKRFTEKGDIVPKLGQLGFKISIKNNKLRKKLNKDEVLLEDGKYKKRIESHALSYVGHENWNKYDFYGVLGGNNELELLEEMKFYDAPIIENK